LHCLDRLFWTAFRQLWLGWTNALIVVKLETVVSWHRAGFRLFWRCCRRARHSISQAIQSQLIRHTVSFRQQVRNFTARTLMARTGVAPSSLAQAFRREVQAIDQDLPVHDVRTLDDQLAQDRWPLRVFGAMFAIFAGIALLLATVGLYAVVAYGVNQRTREIGERERSLGANRLAYGSHQASSRFTLK